MVEQSTTIFFGLLDMSGLRNGWLEKKIGDVAMVTAL